MRSEDEGKRPPRPPSFFYDSGGPGTAQIPREAPAARVVYGDECVHGYWERADGAGFWIGEKNHPMDGGNFLFADKHVVWLGVQWSGAPYKKGRSLPFVPNTHMRTGGAPGGGAAFVTYQDTNVFRDDAQGEEPSRDADLAGMMWVGQDWLEY